MAKIPTAIAGVTPTTKTGQAPKDTPLFELSRKPALRTNQLGLRDLADPRGDIAVGQAIKNVGKLMTDITLDVQRRENALEVSKAKRQTNKFFNDMELEAKQNPRKDQDSFGNKLSSDRRKFLEKNMPRQVRDEVLEHFDNRSERNRVFNVGAKNVAIHLEFGKEFEGAKTDVIFDIGKDSSILDQRSAIDALLAKRTELEELVRPMGFDKVKFEEKMDEIKATMALSLHTLLEKPGGNGPSGGPEIVDSVINNKEWVRENLTDGDLASLRSKVAVAMRQQANKQREFITESLEATIKDAKDPFKIIEANKGLQEIFKNQPLKLEDLEDKTVNAIKEFAANKMIDDGMMTSDFVDEKTGDVVEIGSDSFTKGIVNLLEESGLGELVKDTKKFINEINKKREKAIDDDIVGYIRKSPAVRSLPADQQRKIVNRLASIELSHDVNLPFSKKEANDFLREFTNLSIYPPVDETGRIGGNSLMTLTSALTLPVANGGMGLSQDELPHAMNQLVDIAGDKGELVKAQLVAIQKWANGQVDAFGKALPADKIKMTQKDLEVVLSNGANLTALQKKHPDEFNKIQNAYKEAIVENEELKLALVQYGDPGTDFLSMRDNAIHTSMLFSEDGTFSDPEGDFKKAYFNGANRLQIFDNGIGNKSVIFAPEGMSEFDVVTKIKAMEEKLSQVKFSDLTDIAQERVGGAATVHIDGSGFEELKKDVEGGMFQDLLKNVVWYSRGGKITPMLPGIAGVPIPLETKVFNIPPSVSGQFGRSAVPSKVIGKRAIEYGWEIQPKVTELPETTGIEEVFSFSSGLGPAFVPFQ